MPDQKCLLYGLIHFQYLITDTKSLPTPEQQTAITKLSLSLSRGKQQSTTVIPVLHQGSETSTFLSVAFACTFLKKWHPLSPFFPSPTSDKARSHRLSYHEHADRIQTHLRYSGNHLPFPELVCEQRCRAGQIPRRTEAITAEDKCTLKTSLRCSSHLLLSTGRFYNAPY